MAGFRAAGWTCCGVVALALVIAAAGMRGVGLIGQQHIQPVVKKPGGDVEMAVREAGAETLPHSGADSDMPFSHNGSVATLTDVVNVDSSDSKAQKPIQDESDL